jgi:hypothetical protein
MLVIIIIIIMTVMSEVGTCRPKSRINIAVAVMAMVILTSTQRIILHILAAAYNLRNQVVAVPPLALLPTNTAIPGAYFLPVSVSSAFLQSTAYSCTLTVTITITRHMRQPRHQRPEIRKR